LAQSWLENITSVEEKIWIDCGFALFDLFESFLVETADKILPFPFPGSMLAGIDASQFG